MKTKFRKTIIQFNPDTWEIKTIEPEEWRKIKKEYMEFAREHYKRCKYPHANVFARLFPEEAEKVRRQTTDDRWQMTDDGGEI